MPAPTWATGGRKGAASVAAVEGGAAVGLGFLSSDHAHHGVVVAVAGDADLVGEVVEVGDARRRTARRSWRPAFSCDAGRCAGCRGWARSTAAGPAARPGRPARGWRPWRSASGADPVDEGLVGGQVLRLEPGHPCGGCHPAANWVSVVTVPVRKPLPSGLNGTNPIPSSAQRGQHLRLGVPGPQRVLRLHRGHRVHGVGAADRGRAGLGQPEVAHLALVDELPDGAGDVLDRHVGVDPVLVEQVDRRRPAADAATPRRPGGSSLGPAVQADHRPVVDVASRTWWRSRPGRAPAPAPRRRVPR